MRLFTTFEKEKGTRFKGEDYFLELQQRIKDKRIDYIRPSPQYEGLTEYWSAIIPKVAEQKKKSMWNLYYLVDNQIIRSPEGHRLVILCSFFGVAPGLLVENGKGNTCKMQWNIDASMSTEVSFYPLVLEDWKTMHIGLIKFFDNIRME
jgi:hypothetical protein